MCMCVCVRALAGGREGVEFAPDDGGDDGDVLAALSMHLAAMQPPGVLSLISQLADRLHLYWINYQICVHFTWAKSRNDGIISYKLVSAGAHYSALCIH